MSAEARDIQTVMWKEWKELVASTGLKRGGYRLLLIVAILVVLEPLQSSAHWFDSPLPILFDGLYLPFALLTSLAASAFAGERERHTLETLIATRLSDRAILLGKIIALTLCGWTLSLVASLAQIGVVAVASAARHTQTRAFYSAPVIVGILVLSPLFSLLITGVGSALSLRAVSVQQAQQMLTVAFLTLAIVPVVAVQLIPAQTRAQIVRWFVQFGPMTALIVIALVVALIDGVIVATTLARFRRARLVVG